AAGVGECGEHSRGVVGFACRDEVGDHAVQVAVSGVEEVACLEVGGDVAGLGGVGGVQEGAEECCFGVEFGDGGCVVGGGEVVDVDRVGGGLRVLGHGVHCVSP